MSTFRAGCAASAGTASNMLRRYVRGISISELAIYALNTHVHGRKYVCAYVQCVMSVQCTLLCECIHMYAIRLIWVQYMLCIVYYAIYVMRYVLCMICYASIL
jgi:hypothetical protein